MNLKDTVRKILKESVLNEGKSVPNNPQLWAASLAWAKRRYKVCPSAYCNGAAAKRYKAKGGTWRTKKSLKESQALDLFYQKHNIDPNRLYFLGSGPDSSVYEIDDRRVLSITTSTLNFEISKKVMEEKGNRKLKNFINVFSVDEVDGEYYIITENLDMPPIIERYFEDLSKLLNEQNKSIKEINELVYQTDDNKFKAFVEGLKGMVEGFEYLGFNEPNINAENVGYSRNGTLKTHNLDNK